MVVLSRWGFIQVFSGGVMSGGLSSQVMFVVRRHRAQSTENILASSLYVDRLCPTNTI